MEEEKKLYPFRLVALEDRFPWGTEQWQLADLGWRDSAVRDGWLAANTMGEIMETYLDRIVGDEVFEWYGQQFPFLVKRLKINGKMPLTVCPPDEIAVQRYDSLGREKLWYVLSAEKGARLMLGLRGEMDVASFMEACADGSIENCLNSTGIKQGDVFHIPAGVPHCLSGKAEVLEISESSALDFHIAGWGEALPEHETGLDLGLVEALDFINLGRFPAEHLTGISTEPRRDSDPENVLRLVSLPQFSCSLISLAEPLRISAGEGNSCVAYSCLRGELSVQLPKEEDGKTPYLTVKSGETVLIPAECEEFFLVPMAPGTTLVETLVEHRSGQDSYIDPYAEEPIPGEE